MTQHGFFIDISRCTGCNACVIACKQWHNIPPGPVKWMRVYQWEEGSFPNLDLNTLPIMCMHCSNPVCIEACQHGAIYKEDKYGAVLVDQSKCEGDRKCYDACPYGVPQFAGDEPGQKMSKCDMCIDRLEEGLKPICVLSCSMRALDFGPIEELRAKYGNAIYVEALKKEKAPCSLACPADIDAEGYIRLISEGKVQQALDLIREITPFAGVLGRICTHVCESACLRGNFDKSVSIRSLKRFIADEENIELREKINPIAITKKEKIAVIGSGPSGLSCAYTLIKKGYAVTVFESESEPGGLLRYGIPSYRLPKNILENEINYIRELGVNIETGKKIQDLNSLFQDGYQYIFIGTGAWGSLKLNLNGEDAEGVFNALDFLVGVNSGKDIILGEKVVVVGGGSVAIDAARTAIRLGAKDVHIICLECRDLNNRDRMPAQDLEIEEAEEEGIIIHPSMGINRILTDNGKVTGLETMNCISVRDADGKFNPKFNECLVSIEADTVITAVGQKVTKTSLVNNLDLNINDTIKVDPLTLQTNIKGIFAGGDVAGDNPDVVTAIATGREAAISIDRYIQGEDIKKDRHLKNRDYKLNPLARSVNSPRLDVENRNIFSEVLQNMIACAAKEQAARCLRCGTICPSVVFKPKEPKKEVVVWNAEKALALWQDRHPDNGKQLPGIFNSSSDVTSYSGEMIGRNKLVLKPKNTEELMFYTTDDE
jgi:DMSO reductase iron-sulfur subunit